MIRCSMVQAARWTCALETNGDGVTIRGVPSGKGGGS